MRTRKKLLSVLLILTLTSFLIASVSAVCTDTDGGIDNSLVKGTVTGLDSKGNSVELTDYCGFGASVPNYGTYGLYEVGCADGVAYSNFIVCPSDKPCVNGACGGSLGENKGSSSGGCTDTDRGRDDFTTKGTVTGLDSNGNSIERSDMCGKGQSVPYYGQDGLNEYYCANGAVYADFVPCVGTCSNGACQVASQEASKSEACKDSDNGKNYSVKGLVVSKSGTGSDIKTEQKEDTCAGDKAVYEYYCDNPSYYYNGMKIDIKQDYHFCASNEICKEGACILNENATAGEVAETSNVTIVKIEANETSNKPVEINQSLIDNPNIQIDCSGCLVSNKCYPIGFVKDKQYCSDNGNFTVQKDDKESCENLFECQSGVCVTGECISEGFIQKILSWFRNLFG